MTRESWFDPATGLVSLNEYFQQMESWQTAMADGVISPEELQAQSERVLSLLREVDALITPEQHAELTEIFAEMAVLQAMQATALGEMIYPMRES